MTKMATIKEIDARLRAVHPAVRRAGRVSVLRRHLSRALRVVYRQSVFRVRLAHSVSLQRRAGARRPLRAADDYRDARLPRRVEGPRAGEGADAGGAPRSQ